MGHMGRLKRLLSCSTLQGGLRACGIGQEGGKENLDPAPSSKPPRTPKSKKVGTVLTKQSRCLDADRFRLLYFNALHGLRESVLL